ncbi:MAG: hypothetical protein KBG02_11150 [Haliscomenobacter sp.]|nr:hypothetical protein [Haliscomenobacter sp.]MBK8656408.1 hypothetical protein [Haliscomenobacter sp.]MBP9077408.1 hypothetical protein [Haliscomenobacter sp.]MBP9873249.1 hypothetical protein [Haliscomenobacter sp.]
MKKLIYFLAFFHLSVIAVVIFHGLDSVVHKGWWEKPLAFICSINYSIWQYGFFSPDVGKSSEVKIRVFEDGGSVKEYSTLNGFDFYTHHPESLNRFYGFKHHTATDTVFQDLCARSVATRMLNIHQDAWRVDYTMRSIHYPRISQFKPGAPVDTVAFYLTTFQLR